MWTPTRIFPCLLYVLLNLCNIESFSLSSGTAELEVVFCTDWLIRLKGWKLWVNGHRLPYLVTPVEILAKCSLFTRYPVKIANYLIFHVLQFYARLLIIFNIINLFRTILTILFNIGWLVYIHVTDIITQLSHSHDLPRHKDVVWRFPNLNDKYTTRLIIRLPIILLVIRNIKHS